MARTPPVVYDLREDVFEANALTEATWPAAAGVGYADVVGGERDEGGDGGGGAPDARPAGRGHVHRGLPGGGAAAVLPGCEKTALSKTCVASEVEGMACECDALPAVVVV